MDPRKLLLRVRYKVIFFFFNCFVCEDARDEIRKKTVTFANPSPAMVQSASQDSLGSALSQSSGGPTTNGGQLDILRLSPGQEVVFSATPAGDLAGKIQIQNISTKIVGYKIKTTSPEKYRVRPSTGSLSPGLAATVEIHVSGGQATTVPSSLVRDKFLITAVFLESSELGQQQLADALKTSKPDGQYRLRCQLAGSQAEQGVVGGGGGGGGLLSQYGQGVGAVQGEHDSTRQVASILKKVISFNYLAKIIKFIGGVLGESVGQQAGRAGYTVEAVSPHRAGLGGAGHHPPCDPSLLHKHRLY
jgi:hypothetical protein